MTPNEIQTKRSSLEELSKLIDQVEGVVRSMPSNTVTMAWAIRVKAQVIAARAEMDGLRETNSMLLDEIIKSELSALERCKSE